MALIVPRLDRRISIEKPVKAQDSRFGSSKPTWKTLAQVWAERQDILPSRGTTETIQQGMAQGRQHTRFRLRWRGDVDATMRIREGTKLYQIIGGPAEIGRREYMEFLAVSLTTDGTA